jgi:hypothetical protein
LLGSFQRIRQNLGPCVTCRNMLISYGEELLVPAQPSSWKMSATAYLINSQLPSVYGGYFFYPQSENASCHGDKGPT